MLTTTCQLIENGIISGPTHLIGNIDPIWPLCNRHSIRPCQPTATAFHLTDRSHATCNHCLCAVHGTPLALPLPQRTNHGRHATTRH